MTLPMIQATLLGLVLLTLAGCQHLKGDEERQHGNEHKIVVTNPIEEDVILTQAYVCQIHSRRHIEVRALQEGYLQEIAVREGQAVHQGDIMFKVVPVLYQARLDAERAEAQLAAIEFENTKNLASGPRPVVSQTEVALYEAKLAKARAKVKLAEAELNFTIVRAPFDGIVDRLRQQQGSLVKKDEVLTTLSDNSVMWVYFNLPEARYFEYMANEKEAAGHIELVLADGSTFPQAGAIAAIEAQFNNETGTILFRADFPNPNRLLRHGQTGTVLIRHKLPGALVIPQRATFEILDKRYVFAIDDHGLAHQQLVTVLNELEDAFVVKRGDLDVKTRIVVEGVRDVHDRETVEYEFRDPKDILASQKFHAE